jgi:limonene-1,2-epoxide hydrolase
MPSASDTVTRFLARWAVPGDMDQAFRDAFTAETVWENVGMARTVGVDEALALNKSFEQQLGLATIRVDNLAVAEVRGIGEGGDPVDKVLTERVDHLLDGEGRTIMSARCMGVFEVADGRILAWRDFFEPPAEAVARAQQQG